LFEMIKLESFLCLMFSQYWDASISVPRSYRKRFYLTAGLAASRF
jgi:hypothetical protein